MKLNEDKCHFTIFGERTNQEVSINIGSCAVNNSKEEKLLGVLIDANLALKSTSAIFVKRLAINYLLCHECLHI